MSCEVICLEVPEILQMLAQHPDATFLKRLFRFLESPHELNCHLAGYFEKILEMLFRKETELIIGFINSGGLDMFGLFLNHIDNYSIMQIVQRLMLPHIPFSVVAEPDEAMDRVSIQCQWSFNMEYTSMLCHRMLDGENIHIPLHVSDLLITVVQLSPPDALVISHLCDSKCLEPLLGAMFVGVNSDPERTEDENMLSPQSSISLSSISVLESLISRLSESLVPFDETVSTQEEEYTRVLAATKKCIERVCSNMIPHFDKLREELDRFLTPDAVTLHMSQCKLSFPRLGHRGLQMLKLVESIVRLGDVEVENQLCGRGIFMVAVDMMFHFRLNSLLHLSVQRIVLMIIEAAEFKRWINPTFYYYRSVTENFPDRSSQRHVLLECNLLKRIVVFLKSQSIECLKGKREETEAFGSPMPGVRSPLIGHLLVISQVRELKLQLRE